MEKDKPLNRKERKLLAKGKPLPTAKQSKTKQPKEVQCANLQPLNEIEYLRVASNDEFITYLRQKYYARGVSDRISGMAANTVFESCDNAELKVNCYLDGYNSVIMRPVVILPLHPKKC